MRLTKETVLIVPAKVIFLDDMLFWNISLIFLVVGHLAISWLNIRSWQLCFIWRNSSRHVPIDYCKRVGEWFIYKLASEPNAASYSETSYSKGQVRCSDTKARHSSVSSQHTSSARHSYASLVNSLGCRSSSCVVKLLLSSVTSGSDCPIAAWRTIWLPLFSWIQWWALSIKYIAVAPSRAKIFCASYTILWGLRPHRMV